MISTIYTKVLAEFRAGNTVAILEQEKPNGVSWGGYIVKSYRKFSDEASAQAEFAEAKKIRRPRKKEDAK